jgi:hypothetical protein
MSACRWCGEDVTERNCEPELPNRNINEPRVHRLTACREVILADLTKEQAALAAARAIIAELTAQNAESLDEKCVRLIIECNKAQAERAEAMRWDDIAEDEWSPAINAAFPTRSGSHAEYATALRMVGHRRSKGSLVELVNWLLFRVAEEERKHGEIVRRMPDEHAAIQAMHAVLAERDALSEAHGLLAALVASLPMCGKREPDSEIECEAPSTKALYGCKRCDEHSLPDAIDITMAAPIRAAVTYLAKTALKGK